MCHVHSTTHISCSQEQNVNVLQQPHIWYLKHNLRVLPLPLTLCPMPNVHISCPPPTWPFPISCTNVPCLCLIPPSPRNVHSPNCIMFQMCMSHAHPPRVHTPYYVSHDERSYSIPHPHVHVPSPSHMSMSHAPLICPYFISCSYMSHLAPTPTCLYFMPHLTVHTSFHVHGSSSHPHVHISFHIHVSSPHPRVHICLIPHLNVRTSFHVHVSSTHPHVHISFGDKKNLSSFINYLFV
jgi:hypothetical protein